MSLLILGLLEGGNAWAWNSPQSIGAFVVGTLMFLAFVRVEQTRRRAGAAAVGVHATAAARRVADRRRRRASSSSG